MSLDGLLQQITEFLSNKVPTSYPQSSMYAAVLPTEGAYDTISEVLAREGVYQPADWDAHITVVYSRRCEHPHPDSTLAARAFEVTLSEFSTFPIKDDETGEIRDLCILLVESPGLRAMHNSIMDDINGTYDFDEYRPHITIGFLDQLGVYLDDLNSALNEIPEEQRTVLYGAMYQEEIEE